MPRGGRGRSSSGPHAPWLLTGLAPTCPTPGPRRSGRPYRSARGVYGEPTRARRTVRRAAARRSGQPVGQCGGQMPAADRILEDLLAPLQARSRRPGRPRTRSSKVHRRVMVRRRSGPLVGEPGSVVGRPITPKMPMRAVLVQVVVAGVHARCWPRLAKNALAYSGSSLDERRGEQPERVGEATDREHQRAGRDRGAS